MPYLINIHKDILDDFSKDLYANSDVLYRKFTLKGGTILLVTVYKRLELTEISFSLMEYNPQLIKKLPKWKGMEEKVISGIANEQDTPFLSFVQTEDYDKDIFFTVMQDLINNVNAVNEAKMISSVKETLEKWNVFFQFEKDYVLSENVQQGLYGELHILDKMVSEYGEKIIECWTGCNAETHDFYFGDDALEVKSSSAKGPNKVRISNEYQLDDEKILGHLYLMYLKMKKSEIYGETLPTIVQRISDRLSDSKKIIFYNKLLKVGYVYQMPELYEIHFIIHDETCYKIEDGFPRITKKNIAKGIGSVDYVVSLDACDKYLITIENYYKGVTP